MFYTECSILQSSLHEDLKNIIGEILNAIDEKLGSEGLTKEEISEIKNWIDWRVDFEKVIIHPEYQDRAGIIINFFRNCERSHYWKIWHICVSA